LVQGFLLFNLTTFGGLPMSALGHKRTWWHVLGMSDLHSIADVTLSSRGELDACQASPGRSARTCRGHVRRRQGV